MYCTEFTFREVLEFLSVSCHLMVPSYPIHNVLLLTGVTKVLLTLVTVVFGVTVTLSTLFDPDQGQGSMTQHLNFTQVIHYLIQEEKTAAFTLKNM